jgi:isocitrate lyase
MTAVAPAATENRWAMPGARWKDVVRPYTKEEVERLRGTVKIECSLARLGAERLWKLLQEEDYVPALGAMTGNQAVQQVKAGLM